jgi:hypothetical protein
MFGTRSTHGTTRNGRHSTHTAGRRGFFSRPRRQNKAAGLKGASCSCLAPVGEAADLACCRPAGIEQAYVIAFDRAYTAAINNPNVTSSGRRSAKSQLQHMYVWPPLFPSGL